VPLLGAITPTGRTIAPTAELGISMMMSCDWLRWNGM
jgi:hypothetical protein